jgi:DNA-binding response OmpR family regulator
VGLNVSSHLLHREFPLRHPSRNRHRVILSVDDEPAILFTRGILLEDAGFKVLSAPDGKEALRFFASNRVDPVLLDLAMPGMDGAAVAEELKRLNDTVPVIMVSASPVARQTLTYADRFFEKGQNPGLLLEQINQLLTRVQTYRLQVSQDYLVIKEESIYESSSFRASSDVHSRRSGD